MTDGVFPAPGAVAPDFTLPSTSGADVTLSRLRGRPVLLAFFPLAFTSTCTAELSAMRDDYDQLTADGTVVLPISVDSIPALKVFKEREHLTVDLLSDFRRTVSRLYGTLLEDRFYSNRAYVLVDRAGVVRWSFAEPTPSSRRENRELLAQIAALGS